MFKNYFNKIREMIRQLVNRFTSSLNLKKENSQLQGVQSKQVIKTTKPHQDDEQKLWKIVLAIIILWYISTHYWLSLNSQQIALIHSPISGVKSIVTTSELSLQTKFYQKYELNKPYFYLVKAADSCRMQWSLKNKGNLMLVVALNKENKVNETNETNETLFIKQILSNALYQLQKNVFVLSQKPSFPYYFHLGNYGANNVVLAVNDVKCPVMGVEENKLSDEAPINSLKTEQQLNELISSMSNQKSEIQQKIIALKQEELNAPQNAKFQIDRELASQLEQVYQLDPHFATWHQQLKLFENSSDEIRTKLPMIQPYSKNNKD